MVMAVSDPLGLGSDKVSAGGGSSVSQGESAGALVTWIERVYGQALFGFARRLGIDDEAAADVVQEGLMRLYDALGGRTQLEDPRAWVFTVVYRLAMDEHRRRDRSSRLDGLAARRGDPEADPVACSERAMVWAEVDRLPERRRAVLYLRYRADLPFEVIGRVLGITSSAARSHATQAIATLRGRLA